MKGPFKNLKKWQNYVHYLMLTGAIFIIHHFSNFIEKMVVAGEPWAWTKLFFFYAFWIFIADTAIHYIFYKLPKPWKWED
jgi:hypothetical protein